MMLLSTAKEVGSMARRSNFLSRVLKRREDASVRLKDREARSAEAQLKRLEKRGFGHCKEAKRLRQNCPKG